MLVEGWAVAVTVAVSDVSAAAAAAVGAAGSAAAAGVPNVSPPPAAIEAAGAAAAASAAAAAVPVPRWVEEGRAVQSRAAARGYLALEGHLVVPAPVVTVPVTAGNVRDTAGSVRDARDATTTSGSHCEQSVSGDGDGHWEGEGVGQGHSHGHGHRDGHGLGEEDMDGASDLGEYTEEDDLAVAPAAAPRGAHIRTYHVVRRCGLTL